MLCTRLLWWQHRERRRNLLLPAHLVLAVDLSCSIELLALLEQHRAQDDLVWHNGLHMVWVRGAAWAVVALNFVAYTCVSCIVIASGFGGAYQSRPCR